MISVLESFGIFIILPEWEFGTTLPGISDVVGVFEDAKRIVVSCRIGTICCSVFKMATRMRMRLKAIPVIIIPYVSVSSFGFGFGFKDEMLTKPLVMCKALLLMTCVTSAGIEVIA